MPNKVTAELVSKFDGSYVVTAKVGKNVYEIKDRLSETCQLVHVKDLKKYYGDHIKFHEEDKELDNKEGINSSTFNKTLNTKTPKTKTRERPYKTRVLVKRNTFR